MVALWLGKSLIDGSAVVGKIIHSWQQYSFLSLNTAMFSHVCSQ
jgi:hypothetical protein